MSRCFYSRVQPEGLGINGHRSECSDGTRAAGVHVEQGFCRVGAILKEGCYGQQSEIVILTNPAGHYANNDVHGVEVPCVGNVEIFRCRIGDWVAFVSEFLESKWIEFEDSEDLSEVERAFEAWFDFYKPEGQEEEFAAWLENY